MNNLWSIFDNNFDILWDRNLNRRFNKIETSDNKGISVTYDVPGYDKKDIDISVINNILKIQGDIKDREFNKRWKIDSSVIDITNIKATVKNGVLDMYIPYLKPPDREYRIQIE